ncbi:MAG: YraN family protein [Armatimonadetes bacterium]|nr:YraN family protein [Armatimonadota bacterium]MDE2205324.1 YraN family protein [Armatimonadota bacterium]
MAGSRRLGEYGEECARRYLEGLGWRLLAVNYGTPVGEVDLVFERSPAPHAALVFVEVKTRSGESFGDPAEAVTGRKQARIVAAARRYLAAHPARDEPESRFDVVEVYTVPGKPTRVRHIAAAFGPID